MGIKIGNNNKIKNSTISENLTIENDNKENWFQKHPVVTGILSAVVAGFVLMFSFWSDLVEFIQKFIGG